LTHQCRRPRIGRLKQRQINRLSPFVCLCAALLVAGAGRAHSENVALTFDDLPIYGPRGTIANAQAMTRRLTRGLVRHHLPAIGFVNEIQLESPEREQRIALLTDWLDAGLDLGNHSYSHLSLNRTPVDAYIVDVARGEAVTSGLLAEHGRKEHWYRYPYLKTGTSLETRQRFEGWLAQHSYRVAPVTMENSDWEFADRYDASLARHDKRTAARVRREYLDFTAQVVAWYRMAALQLLGRRPAFVFLLHASRLNAASIGTLSGILRRQDLHAVTLDQAMADPAYSIPDTYIGPDGDEWLSRWSLTLHKELPWSSLPKVPKDISEPDDTPVTPPRSSPRRHNGVRRAR
jgi:peptidoglycan/xylan/chitin deacetylase (PgdA/CDA1 family)